MLIYTGQIQQKAFNMEICARNLLALTLFIFAYAPATAAPFSGDCGFTIDLPVGMTLKKNAGVEAPLCSYLDASTQPTPFVNSVTVVPWAKLDTLQVNGQPLRDIGFFRLPRKLSVNYMGRPSYADPRNAYEQKVLKKAIQKRDVFGKTKKMAVRSELKVKWLKPVDTTIQEEATDIFICVDAAISDDSSVAIVNWCLPKNDPYAAELVKTAKSLRFDIQ